MSGMFTENGPVVTDLYSGKMYTNKYSWNNNANVIYIDSPAGVGFSKSSDLTQKFNDEKTAKGLVAALKLFSLSLRTMLTMIFIFQEKAMPGHIYLRLRRKFIRRSQRRLT